MKLCRAMQYCVIYYNVVQVLCSHNNSLMCAIKFLHLGAVEVSLTGELSLEFNMIDIWRKPFGFKYLAFGNLHLAIGISVGVPLPSFGQYRHSFRTFNLMQKCFAIIQNLLGAA